MGEATPAAPALPPGSSASPGQEVEVALEAASGWLFVCEQLSRAGAVPRLAEPAETSARRGPKRRAKSDRADARHLRELLAEGRLPEAWRPPAHLCAWRSSTRLRQTLVEERTQWLQRIRARLFHDGVPAGEVPARLLERARGGPTWSGSSCRRRRASESGSRWR